MQKRIFAVTMALLLTLSPVARASTPQDEHVKRSYDTENGYIIYTIEEGAGPRVVVSCDEAAASLLLPTDEPGQISRIKLKFVNNTKETYHYTVANFYTVNVISRNVSETESAPPMPKDGEVRTYAPADTGSIGSTKGFDGNLIPYSMNVLRCINAPLKALYGTKVSAAQITLEQVQNADDQARKKGYESYAAYLLQYYKGNCKTCKDAKSLYELEPNHLDEIFGTRVGGLDGQSEIRQPRSLSVADLNSGAYDLLRQYGWASQPIKDKSRTVTAYRQDYELMETDSELIQVGYWFLYQRGMAFTFDDKKFPLSTSVNSETYMDGLQLSEYFAMTGRARRCTDAAFYAVTLKPGDSLVLDNVAFYAQLPNAYDARGIDFGFSVTFESGVAPPPTPTPTPPPNDPDPTPTPKPHPDPDPDPDHTPRPRPTPTPKPTPTPGGKPTPTPTPGGGPTPTPTPGHTPSPPPEATPTPNSTPTPEPTPPGPSFPPPPDETPQPSSPPRTPPPKTGDDNTLAYALVGMGISAAGVIIFFLRRRRDR